MSNTMKLTGVIFTAHSIQAIRRGIKTQTRRIVKPMPGRQTEWLTMEFLNKCGARQPVKADIGYGIQLDHPRGGPAGWIRCPYGEPGARLYVKEAWLPRESGPLYRADYDSVEAAGLSGMYSEKGIWRSPMFMPPDVARTFLEIVSIRVQRVQDISEDDAVAEGYSTHGMNLVTAPHGMLPCISLFREGWDSINGKKYPWSSNPYVWCIEFKPSVAK